MQEQSKNNLKKNPEIKTKENEEEQPTIKILKKRGRKVSTAKCLFLTFINRILFHFFVIIFKIQKTEKVRKNIAD